MPAKKSTDKKNTSSANVISLEIAAILSSSLDKYKAVFGEKKFEKRIKKATKVLAHGIKPVVAEKKAPVKKKLLKTVQKKVKKAAVKKPAKAAEKK